MDKPKQKSKEMRNNINDRMQNFYIGDDKINKNPPVFDSNNLDKEYYNYKPAGTEDKFQNIQKSDFKNDINERMNTINDMTVDNMRRLPLNNNIRDSQITTGSKRDQFNERLSNYSLLSSNMVASPYQIIDNKNTGFHTNFKEDHNERMQELSPLSRNMSIPISKEPTNKKHVMEQIQTGNPQKSYSNGTESYSNGTESYSNGTESYSNGTESYSNGIESYSNGMDTYEFLDDVGNLQVNNMMPMDSRQKFNFKE